MAQYLKPNSDNLSVQERQFLFQCRVNDIYVRANRTWKYRETFCVACKDRSIEEIGIHVLQCKDLVNMDYEISYIPDYNDLYSSDIEEQIYTSRMMYRNMQIRSGYLDK